MTTTWPTVYIIETAHANNASSAAPQELSANKVMTASNASFTTKSSFPEYVKIWGENLREEGIRYARFVRPMFPAKTGFRQHADLISWQSHAGTSL